MIRKSQSSAFCPDWALGPWLEVGVGAAESASAEGGGHVGPTPGPQDRAHVQCSVKRNDVRQEPNERVRDLVLPQTRASL